MEPRSDAPSSGDLPVQGPLPGLRDTPPQSGESAVLDLPAESGGSAGTLASEPTEPRFAGFWVTEREIRAMARGELPNRLIAYCGELVDWLDEPIGVVLEKRRKRRHA